MIKGIIFDMDGLMIDSERVTFEGYVELCAQLGFAFDEESYLNCLGKPVQGIWQVFYDKFGEDFPAKETMAKNHVRMAEIFETQGVPLKKGLKELLEFAREKGYKTVVATSSNRDRVDKILKQSDTRKYFDNSICGDEVERGKPDPDIFLKAAAKIGLKPEEVVVLEDSEMGILAASRAGMKVICIPDMKYPEPEFAARTDCIVKDLLQVRDLLNQPEC